MESLEKLCDKFAIYDNEGLLTLAASLQLCPENLERTVRLEAIAFALSCIKMSKGKPQISLKKFRDIINSDESLSFLATQEDPAGNLFTEEIHFFGGGYKVFPGTVENATFITKNILKGIFLSQERGRANHFYKKASEICQAIFLVSNDMAEKAGLNRNEWIEGASDKKIIVPFSNRIRTLENAVTFTKTALESLLAEKNISLSVLDSFISVPSIHQANEYSPEEIPHCKTPLLDIGDKILVLFPNLLLAALRHAVICLALDLKVEAHLAEAYDMACWDNVINSLRYIGSDRITDFAFSNPSEGFLINQGLFDLDADKAIYVQHFSDNLRDYDPQLVFGKKKTEGLLEELDKLQKKAESQILKSSTGLNEIIILIVQSGFGYWSVLGFNDSACLMKPKSIYFSSSDLEEIALLEAGNSLILWQYAHAHSLIRDTVKVFQMGALDEFGFFRHLGYSYYASDKGRPNVISIFPDFAGAIHRENCKKHDIHTVASYNKNCTIEVKNLYEDERSSIFFPLGDLGKRISLCVEGYPLPIWVVCREEIVEKNNFIKKTCFELAEMIAYWLGEFTEDLAPCLSQETQNMQSLVLQIELERIEEWSDSIGARQTRDAPEVKEKLISASFEEGMILKLFLSPRVGMSFYGQSNEGERLFMVNVLEELSKALKSERLSFQNITAIIDKNAPLGRKKKIIVGDTGLLPMLDSRNLPKKITIKKYDANILWDKMGGFLTEKKKIREGVIAGSERNKILHDIVSYLFDLFVEKIRCLNPVGLMERLISLHERLLYERSLINITTPTRFECFNYREDIVQKLKTELSEINKASLAVRFLIEYCTAKPPTGLRHLSNSFYGELLSISGEIIDIGTISDLIHYNIHEYAVSLLPSGRLGFNDKGFAVKMQEFFGEHLEEKILALNENFDMNWKEAPKEEQGNQFIKDFDAAFEAEWGYSHKELAESIKAFYEVGQLKNHVYGEMDKERAEKLLVEKVHIAYGKAVSIIKSLSLEEREDFLNRNGKNGILIFPRESGHNGERMVG